MGLLQKACETYDNHKYLIGKSIEGSLPLVPIGHILQNANLEITIDYEGNFIIASLIAKENEKTIIPVTIASGGRSGKDPAPHPLCDKLQYYLHRNTKKYDLFKKQLQEWNASTYGLPKLQAVLAYLESGKIEYNLKESKIIAGDIASDKEEGLFIRWRIEGVDDNETACWKDNQLFDSWTNYYLSILEGSKDLCMITGADDIIVENHPKNIVPVAANAKLISTNDATNFTYRGRFIAGNEAGSVGYITSQKAHNALRWEASKGKIVGGRLFMCWNPQGKNVPKAWSPINFGNEKPLSPTDYSKELRDTLTGYRNSLLPLDDVIIASMDAATTGRLSVTYYNELKASDFLDRIENWYKTLSWINGKFGVQSPSVYQIVKAAYGLERSETGKVDIDDRISRDNQQRLFKCIIDRQAIPYDIVKALVNKASRPSSYNIIKYHNYKEVLYVACAVIRKYLNDKYKKEEWTLALNETKIERSYLFGRLLAVMEKVERDTYDKEEQREPNAIRMQSAFCEKPYYYANLIHNSLNPYFARLNPGQRTFYKKLIGSIMELLSEFTESELNKPLTEAYLMGYYLQRNNLYTAKKKENENVEVVEND